MDGLNHIEVCRKASDACSSAKFLKENNLSVGGEIVLSHTQQKRASEFHFPLSG